MNIGIIGMGVVGSAVYELYSKNDIVYGYDKYKMGDDGELAYPWSEEIIKRLDVIFLCLPTPTGDVGNKETGSRYLQNLDPIHDAISDITLLNKKAIFILKSTVLPGTTDMLADKYGINIVHCPEFLSELTAKEDFEKQETIYLGIPDSSELSCSDTKRGIFLNLVDMMSDKNKKEVILTTSKESEMIKYAANCFYATKVVFFHSLYENCQEMDVDFDTVRDFSLKSMGWINPMHTKAPGRHGLGYAGLCFPKDVQAFSLVNDFMKAVDKNNKNLRDSKHNNTAWRVK